MANLRQIDLDAAPDARAEIRLQLEDCIISIWLPASAGTLGRAMTALAEAGFDVPPVETEQAAAERAAP